MAKKHHPIPNGRDHDGRFLPGNPGGPGSPYPKLAQKFKLKLYECITPEDVHGITRELVRKGIEDPGPVGVAAAKVLFDYLLGLPNAKPAEPDRPEVQSKPIVLPDYEAVEKAMMRLFAGKKSESD